MAAWAQVAPKSEQYHIESLEERNNHNADEEDSISELCGFAFKSESKAAFLPHVQLGAEKCETYAAEYGQGPARRLLLYT